MGVCAWRVWQGCELTVLVQCTTYKKWVQGECNQGRESCSTFGKRECSHQTRGLLGISTMESVGKYNYLGDMISANHRQARLVTIGQLLDWSQSGSCLSMGVWFTVSFYYICSPLHNNLQLANSSSSYSAVMIPFSRFVLISHHQAVVYPWDYWNYTPSAKKLPRFI